LFPRREGKFLRKWVNLLHILRERNDYFFLKKTVDLPILAVNFPWHFGLTPKERSPFSFFFETGKNERPAEEIAAGITDEKTNKPGWPMAQAINLLALHSIGLAWAPAQAGKEEEGHD
jgi:hypothetical protein